MSRNFGVISRGVIAPIIKAGDNIEDIVVNTILKASEEEGIELKDRDVIAITESVVARAQNNYATVDEIAIDIYEKIPDREFGVIFPILSRNRFAICLKSMARAANKIYLMLSYPGDEVGNKLINNIESLQLEHNSSHMFTEQEWIDKFGMQTHPFTGVNYIQYYKDIILSENCEVEIILSNDPTTILKYTKNVITCDIHTREYTKQLLKDNGGEIVLGLDDIMTHSINKSGYNEKYGLLGTNKATEESVKLFPRKCEKIVDNISNKLYNITNKHIEVMIYGDGAFKDPVGGIWELADPVVSPAYTSGLKGTPNELKLKFLADNEYSNLNNKELETAIKETIRNKDANLIGNMSSQGTTPRQITDLLGSLSDLTSGSGDKGTPIIWISGYFDNYATT